VGRCLAASLLLLASANGACYSYARIDRDAPTVPLGTRVRARFVPPRQLTVHLSATDSAVWSDVREVSGEVVEGSDDSIVLRGLTILQGEAVRGERSTVSWPQLARATARIRLGDGVTVAARRLSPTRTAVAAAVGAVALVYIGVIIWLNTDGLEY
jgi:hypothetical protein